MGGQLLQVSRNALPAVWVAVAPAPALAFQSRALEYGLTVLALGALAWVVSLIALIVGLVKVRQHRAATGDPRAGRRVLAVLWAAPGLILLVVAVALSLTPG